MAGRTITQRIALNGGAEIKAQLEQIGAAGKVAFDKLSAAANQSAAFTKLGDTVAVLGTRFRALGASASSVNDNMHAVGGAVLNTSRSIGLIGLAVGGAVAGLAALFKAAGDAQEQLQNTADILGETAEKYQAVRDAAEVAGVDGGVFDKSILKLVSTMKQANQQSEDYRKKINALNRDQAAGRVSFEQYNARMLEIQQSASDTTNVFKDLGVSITENGKLRDPLKVANDIADAFSEMPNGADKAAKSLELFSTRNAKFGAFLNQGSKGIQELTLAAQRLAPALDKEGRAALDRAADSFTNLGKASGATKNQILAVFAPNVSALVEAYTGVVVRSREAWVNYAKTIEARVKPIVADIVAVLEGRDADVKNSFIIQARDAFVQFGEDAKNAVFNVIIPALKAMLGVLQSVADAINGVFGTKLSGGQIAIALIIGRVTGLLRIFTTTARLAWSAVMLLFRSMSVLTGSIGVLARVVGVVVAAFGAVPLAIAAVGFAVGFLVVTIVQKLGGVTGIIAKVQAAFGTFSTFVQGVAVSIGTFFANAWAGLLNQISVFVASVIAWFARIPTTLGIIFGAIASVANIAWQAISDGAAALWQGLVDGFTTAIDSIIVFFTETLPAGIMAAFEAVVSLATGAWEAIKQTASDAVNWIVNGFKSGVDRIVEFFTGLLTRATEIFKSIIAGARAVAGAVSAAAGGGSAQKTPGFASGGLVRGPGNGRSDSITARISNGEFVQQFSAVRKYGVAFMNALNQGRISVGKIREVMSGVNLGGIAENMSASLMPGVPRFRDGGLVSVAAGGGQRPFTLVLPGGQSVTGMTASEDAVNQIQRYAAGKAIRSAGRAPNWVR